MEEAQRTGAGGGFIPVQQPANEDDDFVSGISGAAPPRKDGSTVPQPPTPTYEGPMHRYRNGYQHPFIITHRMAIVCVLR